MHDLKKDKTTQELIASALLNSLLIKASKNLALTEVKYEQTVKKGEKVKREC